MDGVGWEKNAEVLVWIDPAITGQMRQGITESFDAWEIANQNNGTGVTFTYTDTQPAAGTKNTYIFRKGKVYDPDDPTKRLRGITTYVSDNTTGITDSAETTIDETITWGPAARETAVHEIAHPQGLDHCEGSGCTPECSIMTPVVEEADDQTASLKFNTTYDRATSPTNCDNNTVREAVSPPLIGGGGGGGGGGLPGGGGGPRYPYDSCTPYYWVYYESWDGGETWHLVDAWYAGCW